MSIESAVREITKPTGKKVKREELERRVRLIKRYFLLKPIIEPQRYYMDLKKILLKGTTVLLVLLSAPPIFAAETLTVATQTTSKSTDHSARSSELVRVISVGVLIEIPAQRLLFRHHLSVVEGSTVSQALESVYEVKHGLVCCDSRDIKTINGLSVDPYQDKWWIIKVNGNRQNTSSRTILKEGDIIEFIYEENPFYGAQHVRLEDWVKNKWE